MQPIVSRRKGRLGLQGCAVALILVVISSGACVSMTKAPLSTLPVASSPVETARPSPSPTEMSSLTESALPEDWSYRWLKGIPCRPPCWEGITPGQTTAREAEEILRQSPIIGSGP